MADTPGRLVKVQLRPDLVARMDRFIHSSDAYAGRTEVITDALEGFFTDLAELDPAADVTAPGPAATAAPALTLVEDPPDSGREVSELPPAVASRILRVPEVPGAVPTASPTAGPEPEAVSFGMHNRDFPTLWAAGQLALETAEGAPVEFGSWSDALVQLAGQASRSLVNVADLDVAGFPSSDKREQSEDRFRTFFLGAGPGTGPLFDLGLAGVVTGSQVALTPAAVTLLGDLKGLSCRTGAVTPAQRKTWITYLRSVMPGDVKFFTQIVDAIAGGADRRNTLLEVIGATRTDWKASIVSTNTAGALGRLREWGIVEPRQVAGRYILNDPNALAPQEVAS